jgi:hypothetical protein
MNWPLPIRMAMNIRTLTSVSGFSIILPGRLIWMFRDVLSVTLFGSRRLRPIPSSSQRSSHSLVLPALLHTYSWQAYPVDRMG